jgi:hypothetical protein
MSGANKKKVRIDILDNPNIPNKQQPVEPAFTAAGPVLDRSAPGDGKVEYQYQTREQRDKQAADAEKARLKAAQAAAWADAKERTARFGGALVKNLVNAATGGALGAYEGLDNRRPNPGRLDPMIDREKALAEGRLKGSEGRNEYLKGGKLPEGAALPGQATGPTPPDMIDGGYVWRELDGARALGANGHVSNEQLAAMRAANDMLEYDRKRQEYYGALSSKIDAVNFDLQTQGTQLAESLRNAKPETQRLKLGAWFTQLESNPAYSPRAPGITAAEAAARAETLTAVKKHVIQRMQQ